MSVRPDEWPAMNLPRKILTDIPCDRAYYLLQKYAQEEAGYRVEIVQHLSPWGQIDHDDRRIWIKYGLSPAEAILAITHEIGHAMSAGTSTGSNDEYCRSEVWAEVFSAVVAQAFGCNFYDRCVTMVTRYLDQIPMKTYEETEPEAGFIYPLAYHLLSWVANAAKETTFEPTTYHVHRCPDWSCCIPLFDPLPLYPKSLRVQRTTTSSGRCDPSSCSRHPGYREAAQPRLDNI